MKTIDINVLREHFRYDSDTGLIYRLTGRKKGKVAGYNCNGYRVIYYDGFAYYAHRIGWALAYGKWPPLFVDHIDQNRSNNRLSNLRLADYSINNRNRAGWAKSGYKGVTKRKNSYRAQICYGDGKVVHLGSFKSAEEAYACYLGAAKLRDL